MKITIKEISISYFKGIRSLRLALNPDITSIYGDNGTGKSTICDAVLWTLFDKNSDGVSKFSIKTYDSNGVVIPNVRHSVKLSLDIDGVIRDLEKVYVEERVTRRGRVTDEIKHNTEYYIDGESYTKRDYEKFISDIINESTFKAVTDPRYFPSLHWKDQRAFLERIAGDIDYSSLDNDSRFDEITHQSQFKSLEEYLQHLAYNIKQTKEKIDAIPIRIEEINMARPVERDWDAIAKEIADLQKDIEERKQILYALTHNSEDALTANIRKQIEFQHKRLDTMRDSARRMADSASDDYHNRRNQLLSQINQSKSQLVLLEQKQSSLNELIRRATESVNELLAEKQELQNQWNNLKAEKLSISPDQLVCETCGRPFEDADREKAIADIKSNWLSNHEMKKQAIKANNTRLKERIAEAEALLMSYKAALDGIDYTSLKEEIAKLETDFGQLVAPKSADEILNANPSYVEAKAKIAELQAQLDGTIVTDNSAAIGELQAIIPILQSTLAGKQKELAEKDTYLRCLARMQELETELSTLREQYDSLMLRKDVALEYQSLRDNLLEESVNSKFSLVQFRLFETLNDGTRKPNCVCWVSTPNGLCPFDDANSAMKMNAGLDIITSISNFYGVYAPIVIDNAEGANNILPTDGQQIRLYVSQDKELTIR